jgi:hypothetical protein
MEFSDRGAHAPRVLAIASRDRELEKKDSDALAKAERRSVKYGSRKKKSRK